MLAEDPELESSNAATEEHPGPHFYSAHEAGCQDILFQAGQLITGRAKGYREPQSGCRTEIEGMTLS